MSITRAVLIIVCLLSIVEAREKSVATEPTSTREKIGTETAERSQIQEKDYYSDVDEDYEQAIQDIRSMRNYVNTGVFAISFLVTLCIIIILVHMKSRKVSQLMHLR